MEKDRGYTLFDQPPPIIRHEECRKVLKLADNSTIDKYMIYNKRKLDQCNNVDRKKYKN